MYAALEVALLALVASSQRLNSRLAIASATLSFLASCSIVTLAHFEHVKSIRPSFLLTLYLLVSLLFDAARLRTEWLISAQSNSASAAVLSASVALKLSLLTLETVEKRRILINAGKTPSQESTSGPLSRGFFVWLNPLLITGWANVLTNNDLPNIYERLSSKRLSARFAVKWDKGRMAAMMPVMPILLTTPQQLRVARSRCFSSRRSTS